MSWIRRHPTAAFFALAYGWTWLFWIPRAVLSHVPGQSATGLFALHTAGVYGPLLAGLMLSGLPGRRKAVGSYLSPWRLWRVGLGWYALVLLIRPGTMLAAGALQAHFGGAQIAIAAVTPLWLLLSLGRELAGPGLGEETGWAGFAQPRLTGRHGLLIGSLLLGVLWALWHLPMFFTVGDGQYGSSFMLYTARLVGLRVVFGLAFAATGSLLLPALGHASMNLATDLIEQPPNNLLALTLLWLVVFALIVRRRPMRVMAP